jgi:hypothetical protein
VHFIVIEKFTPENSGDVEFHRFYVGLAGLLAKRHDPSVEPSYGLKGVPLLVSSPLVSLEL